jgi:20S proteasome alpha/beta subunit
MNYISKTTIMAIKYDGGIILGADARSANVRLVNQIMIAEHVCRQPCL